MDRAPPRIFSPARVASGFARARTRRAASGEAGYLHRLLAEDLVERLDFMRAEPASALLVGDETEMLADWVERKGGSVEPASLARHDAERPWSDRRHDLVAHVMGLGMVNDLPGALLHAREALADGGLFFAAFPGAGSLPVLRQVMLAGDGERPAGRMHPMVDASAGSALLQRAGFARHVVDHYPLEVRFRSLAQLVSDLRDHGLTSRLAGDVPPLSRTALARAEAAFDALREADGKVTERFEILVLTGWRG